MKKMGGVCNIHGKGEKWIQNFSGFIWLRIGYSD
jgi:hypothetical protein